jgi:hypothetical protein
MKKKATSTKKSKRLSSKKEIPWIGMPEDLTKYCGFVYQISNLLTNKKYIGRKYLWKTVKKAVVGKKRRIRSTVESDWKYYTGSCKPLNEDIKRDGIDNYLFEVLHLCRTRVETNYLECKEQFTRDVLFSKDPNTCDYIYYNTNILSRYFRETL